MKPLLYAALAAYVVAAIHSILAFVNKRRAVERIALWTLGVGFAAHTAAIVADWVRDGHYPLLHLHETISFLGWTIVIAYAAALYRYRTQALGVFALPLVSLLVLASNFVYDRSGVLATRVTESNTAWLFPIHTTLLVFAYAAFFVAFSASVMYLLQERELKLKTFGAIFHRLPSLSTVDDISWTAASVGFTLLSLGIVTGVVWSSASKGRVWHNDPVEFFALLTWVLYLALIHYRARWRGRKAAWLGIAGFALVVCTFLGAVVLGGFHVYG
ncbi:MAG TPA: cytochrome c biogenesis protein CcsA [Pyrinomonadaceae bacterium]|nr:cytochrome c biogenesis protein CcsA [Pyrinomonadaceae bacterium]